MVAHPSNVSQNNVWVSWISLLAYAAICGLVWLS